MKKFPLCTIVWAASVASTSLEAVTTPTFECTVTSVHAIAEDGRVVNDTEHLKKQLGSRFSVEKSTGAMRGGEFIDNRNRKHIKVTNSPPDNSYYLVTESHGPFVMIGYLYIGNHRKGPQKPFTYTASGEYIYSGFCRDRP